MVCLKKNRLKPIVKNCYLWFNNKSIQTKFAVIFITASLFASILVGIVTYITASSIVIERYESEAGIRRDQTGRDIESLAVRDTYNIYSVYCYLTDKLNTRVYGDYSHQNRLFLISMAIMNAVGTNAEPRLYFFDDSVCIYTNDNPAVFGDLPLSPEQLKIYADSLVFRVSGEALIVDQRAYVPCIIKTRLKGTLTAINYMAANIDMERYELLLDEYSEALGATSMIVDSYGRVIACNDGSYLGSDFASLVDLSAIDSDGAHAQIGNKNYLTFKRNVRYYDWTYYMLVPSELVKKQLEPVLLAAVLSSMMFMFVAVLMIIFTNRIVSRPLKMLTSEILSDELPYGIPRFRPKFKDEIGKLSQAFHEKNEQIDRYIKDIAEAEERYNQAEFTALTAQLNPHVLHNTLSTIIWLIDDDRREDAVSATKALSDVLRNAMGRGKRIIFIREEVEFLRSYIAIQQFRYGDHFKPVFMVDEEILQYGIPRMVLQPIVENAIYHGIKHLDGCGIIRIKGSLENDDIVFEVMDSGPAGQEIVDMINQELESSGPPKLEGLGIRNVHLRLLYHYGEGYGVRYFRRDNFTIAQIRLHAKYPEE